MNTFRPLFAAFLVVLMVLTSGCATVTKGSSQAVTLHTDPDGASCEVTRDSKPITSIAITPGQVQVSRDWRGMDIACRKSGYQPTELRVDSTLEGWTFGNILIGGLVGFAVDAASGAMRQYPQFITLTLVPEEFANVEDRDRYVQERMARFEKEAAAATAQLDKTCSLETCPNDYKQLQELKAKRIALLNERVDKARIRTPAARPEDVAAVAKPTGN